MWTETVSQQQANESFTTDDIILESPMSEKQLGQIRKKLIDDVNFNFASSNKKPPKSQIKLRKQHTVAAAEKADHVNLRDKRPLHRGMGLDLSSSNSEKKAKPVPSSPEETNNNRNSYPELNDSSASDSPTETPTEPTVDLPSVNFENLLESRETDILNDSFHSDSSQDTHEQSRRRSRTPTTESSTTTTSSTTSSAANLREQYSESSDSSNNTLTSDVQIQVEGASPEPGVTPVSDSADDEIGQQGEYSNQEVVLRNKKGEGKSKMSPEASPIWKRKSATFGLNSALNQDLKRMSNISEASEPDSLDGAGYSSSPSSDTASMNSETSTYQKVLKSPLSGSLNTTPRINDKQRKRLYRIGLNLFNK